MLGIYEDETDENFASEFGLSGHANASKQETNVADSKREIESKGDDELDYDEEYKQEKVETPQEQPQQQQQQQQQQPQEKASVNLIEALENDIEENEADVEPQLDLEINNYNDVESEYVDFQQNRPSKTEHSSNAPTALSAPANTSPSATAKKTEISHAVLSAREQEKTSASSSSPVKKHRGDDEEEEEDEGDENRPHGRSAFWSERNQSKTSKNKQYTNGSPQDNSNLNNFQNSSNNKNSNRRNPSQNHNRNYNSHNSLQTNRTSSNASQQRYDSSHSNSNYRNQAQSMQMTSSVIPSLIPPLIPTPSQHLPSQSSFSSIYPNASVNRNQAIGNLGCLFENDHFIIKSAESKTSIYNSQFTQKYVNSGHAF